METPKAVVGNVGGAPVFRCDDFVGIFADRYLRQHLQRGRIDNGHGVILFGKNQERCSRCGLPQRNYSQDRKRQCGETVPQSGMSHTPSAQRLHGKPTPLPDFS
jgi:hypothetical protein